MSQAGEQGGEQLKHTILELPPSHTHRLDVAEVVCVVGDGGQDGVGYMVVGVSSE